MSDHISPEMQGGVQEAAVASPARTFDSQDHEAVDVNAFVREVVKAKREVEVARMQFNLVCDPLVVDHIVFRLGAAEKRLNYLFQLARKLGVSLDGMSLEWLIDN